MADIVIWNSSMYKVLVWKGGFRIFYDYLSFSVKFFVFQVWLLHRVVYISFGIPQDIDKVLWNEYISDNHHQVIHSWEAAQC